MWHIWIYGICIYIYIYSDILSGIYSDILSEKLAYILTFFLAFNLASILTFFLASIYSVIFWHSLWHVFGSRCAPQHPRLAIWCSTASGAGDMEFGSRRASGVRDMAHNN